MEGIARVLARINEIESRMRAGSTPSTFSSPQFPEALVEAGINMAGLVGTNRGQQVVDAATRHLGVPYVWGGEGPRGFDCSGLVKYVFNQFGVELPHYTVTQAQRGTPVGRSELRPGDVIFFGEDGGTGFLYHVGIYVGNGSFLHAPQTGDVVKVSRLEGRYDRNYACARRYL